MCVCVCVCVCQHEDCALSDYRMCVCVCVRVCAVTSPLLTDVAVVDAEALAQVHPAVLRRLHEDRVTRGALRAERLPLAVLHQGACKYTVLNEYIVLIQYSSSVFHQSGPQTTMHSIRTQPGFNQG